MCVCDSCISAEDASDSRAESRNEGSAVSKPEAHVLLLAVHIHTDSLLGCCGRQPTLGSPQLYTEKGKWEGFQRFQRVM